MYVCIYVYVRIEQFREREMFKLRRHKSSTSDNSGDKFGFIFSNIQALQVPKGWDKLSVSLISVEAGKTISKLGKASVNNGTCQWTESLWSPENYASNGLDHFKFLVSMGSSRAGILGEATVNVGHYRNSEASIPVSLPLQKCNKGTVLNFEIKCLTPRTSFRGDEVNSTAAYNEEENSVCNGIDNKSEERNNSLPSMEDSLGRDSLSSASNSSAVVNNAIRRLESTESGGSAPWSSYSYGSPKSNNSPNKLSISCQEKHPEYTEEEIGQCSLHITRTSIPDANIEELKAEARMWELNARRLMVKMETLRKEFANQSQRIADMEMELSTAHTESNRLMHDIKRLEVLLEESNAKQIAAENLNLQAKNTENILKEMEDELKFQTESNSNLSLQLRKSQESNAELVSVLQEMEETVQKKKIEIENLLALNSRSDVMGVINSCGDEDNVQPKSTEQVSVEKQCQEFKLQHLQESHMSLENSIICQEKAQEEKIHEIELEQDLRAQGLLELESKSSSAEESEANKPNMHLIEEIESLKKTIQELERECNELTEENLELLFKLKESRKDPSENHDMLSSKSLEGPQSESLIGSEFETSKHGFQFLLLQKEVIEEEVPNSLQIHSSGQRENHTCLEPPNFQAFKCKGCDLNVKLHACCVKATDKQATEITVNPSEGQRDEIDSRNFTLKDVSDRNRYSEPETTFDIDSLVPALCEQLGIFFHNVNGVEHMLFSPVNIELRNATFYKDISRGTDPMAQKEHAKAVFDKLVQLLRARLVSCTNDKYSEDGARTEVNNTYEIKDKSDYGCSTEKDPCSSHQGYKNFKELEVKGESIGNNVLTKNSKMLEVKTGCLEEDVGLKALNHCRRDLANKIYDHQMVAWMVEKDMEKVQTEKDDITSDSMREEMMVVTGRIFGNISEKIQEMKILELENEKQELESCVFELEKENMQLSERVSGLEAQLRHFTDAMELSRMELQHKGTQLCNLQDEIRELEKDKESQELELKQRLMEMQKRWLDSQEESEYLKKANPKLQATAESLIEECDSLQILNGELRRQRLELKVQCNLLEAELRKYQHSLSSCLSRIESLEAKLSSILEETSSKEKIMNSELEMILLQTKEFKERLVIKESLQSQLCQHKLSELEYPQQKSPHLVNQMFDPSDREDGKASEGSHEMHSLFAENKMLKLTLQEIQQNLEITEVKLVTTQMEYERKVYELMGELNAHKTNQVVLEAKSDKLQRWLENVISSESNLKCIIDNLESKLLLSESERLQLADANSSLKIELLKIAFLRDEVLALKGSLNDMKFKNERLEASLQLICGENEELKADKTSLIQELTGMQNSVTELEECRLRKVVLEEKVLRLEGDLTAREVMCAKDAELKNDLTQSKRVNSQLRWKIKQLELERYYLSKELQSVQEELNRKENSVPSPCKEQKLSKARSSQCNNCETIQIVTIDDCSSRCQVGDDKTQFKSLQPEGQSTRSGNENEQKISQLEAELKEISERYLHMSLKYAEVENQKGKLVMTLKALQDQRTGTVR
ncbi:PREDICTED: golgin subfamily B member 1-like isoform X2 [Ipomoea nil]|uniref:golgin subfamily B member 1-like isoform X2 n=1 Tax=Ipomoea nil TaxID=35883 RepID=UPI000901965C|nr:PREDICTED: golgin subfamily B member 1-like isoform X2 [Ipomoea nil]